MVGMIFAELQLIQNLNITFHHQQFCNFLHRLSWSFESVKQMFVSIEWNLLTFINIVF